MPDTREGATAAGSSTRDFVVDLFGG